MNKYIEGFTNFFKRVFGSSTFQSVFQAAITNILSLTTTVAIDTLTNIALKEAGSVENSGLSGAEKRDVVLNKLKEAAIKEGITVTTTTLNLILETVVNSLKK